MKQRLDINHYRSLLSQNQLTACEPQLDLKPTGAVRATMVIKPTEGMQAMAILKSGLAVRATAPLKPNHTLRARVLLKPRALMQATDEVKPKGRLRANRKFESMPLDASQAKDGNHGPFASHKKSRTQNQIPLGGARCSML